MAVSLKLRKHSVSNYWRQAVAILWLLALIPAAGSPQDTFSETEVKAVFLYNFASFVRWPSSTAQNPPKPFRYCVLDEEMAPILLRIIQGETVEGKPLMLSQEVNTAHLSECQVLYLGRDNLNTDKGWELVRQAPAAQVLTVSDLETFATRGGMIALVRKDRRIQPLINIDMVEKSQLRVSSKLLNLATITRDSEPRQ
jgi:hypothetical protein